MTSDLQLAGMRPRPVNVRAVTTCPDTTGRSQTTQGAHPGAYYPSDTACPGHRLGNGVLLL